MWPRILLRKIWRAIGNAQPRRDVLRLVMASRWPHENLEGLPIFDVTRERIARSRPSDCASCAPPQTANRLCSRNYIK